MGLDLLIFHEVTCRTISALCSVIAAVNIILVWIEAAPHNCVAQIAQQIFRQIDQKAQAILGVLASIFGRYDKIIGKQDA